MTTLSKLYYDLTGALAPRLALLDGLPALALRIYLAPVLWLAGKQKIANMDATIDWFANPDWGLGLPAPALLAHLCAYTEAIGALLLLLGLATRWVALPLMVVMVVAALTVHWSNGWAAIADSALPEIAQRLDAAEALLRQHGNYDWFTQEGALVIFNNGIEFAVTYLLLLLALLALGGGRYVSVDYYLARLFPRLP